MALLVFLAAVLASAGVVARGAGVVQEASSVTTPHTMSLCAALQSVDRGQEVPIVVSGVYVFYPQVLYDPQHPSCEQDVQPST
jgi:hypothetical protein